MSLCPECETHIHLAEETRPGWIIFCPDCQVPLEVSRREPVEFVLALEMLEGDWGD